MVERKTVVSNERIVYKGLLNVKELLFMVDKWFREHRYDKLVEKNEEQVSNESKYIDYIIRPYKKITDYVKFEFKITFNISNMTEVVKEVDGHKMKLNEAEVKVIFYSYLVTDYEGKWESKPEYFFLRTIFEKFVYKMHINNWEDDLVDETRQLKNEINAYLNMNRYE